MKIYTDKPDVYIKRLADLIFGTEIRKAMGRKKNSLDDLNPVRLESFIGKALVSISSIITDFVVSLTCGKYFPFLFSSHSEAVRNESKPGIG